MGAGGVGIDPISDLAGMHKFGYQHFLAHSANIIIIIMTIVHSRDNMENVVLVSQMSYMDSMNLCIFSSWQNTGVMKTQTLKTKTSNPEKLRPLHITKTHTPDTQTCLCD